MRNRQKQNRKKFKEYYYQTSYERSAENFPYVFLIGVVFFGSIWLLDKIFHFLK